MMVNENRFPNQLLSESIDHRLQYFKAKIIAHPRLKEAYDQLIQTIYYPTDASLVFVFGPVGYTGGGGFSDGSSIGDFWRKPDGGGGGGF